MRLKGAVFVLITYFLLCGLVFGAAKAEYYHDMPGEDALVIAQALQALEDDVTKAFKPEEKEGILKEVYEAIERDQESNFRIRFRLLDIYAELMKEHKVTQKDAIAMFQNNAPGFYKIYHKKRKELLLESIERVRSSINYLRVEKVWSDGTNEKNIKLLRFLRETANKFLKRTAGVNANQGTINKVLQKAITEEQAAMAEDQNNLQLAKDKLRSQLKVAMDKLIKENNLEPLEKAIMQRYGLTAKEARSAVLNHDEKAYTVLRDLILNINRAQ
jgi:hypothetical protein